MTHGVEVTGHKRRNRDNNTHVGRGSEINSHESKWHIEDQMSGNASVSFHSLPKASEEQQMPSSEQRLPPPVQTVGFLCTEMSTDVVGSAQIAAVSPAPGHISKWPHSMTILSYFPHCNSPFRTGFYSPVKSRIIVSTFGFNFLKEGGFVKEVPCKQPPVYFTHYKLQKGLRNGLNLHPLNYRLARPGIL